MFEYEIGPPAAGTAALVESGTAVVTRFVDAPSERVWRALTDPALVCRWFGILIPALEPGVEARFDFGDGDFFAVQDVVLEPPFRLRYAWRFLGIGPLDAIDWQLTPHAGGCTVTVTDSEPGRSPEAGGEMREGWLDFTERLHHFLATGEPARYDLREEFDAGIELPGRLDDAAAVVLAPGRYARWLPLDGPDLADGTGLYVEDGKAPVAFTIADVRWETPVCVHFSLSHRSWPQPTPCTLALTANARTTFLMVRQTGWRGVGGSVDVQRAQRRRFSALWIAALEQARRLLDSEAGAA